MHSHLSAIILAIGLLTSVSQEFVLGSPTNSPPTISAITNVTMQSNSAAIRLVVVNDAETEPAALALAGSSSNKTLLPEANILFSGGGSSRQIVLVPAQNQTGQTTVTITVTDSQSLSATTTFQVTVISGNTPPTISAIGDKTIQKDETTRVTFTLADAQTPLANLVITISSSNKQLVPDNNMTIGDANGANRDLVIVPATGQIGQTAITVTVLDMDGASASANFVLTVGAISPGNTVPTISVINDLTIPQNRVATAAIAVNDSETAPGALLLAAESNNSLLVPQANILFGGSGTNRTLVVVPARNQTGSAKITITATDASGGAASISFTLTVVPAASTKGDLDGDGQSDLVFQDTNGRVAVWLMKGVTMSSAYIINLASGASDNGLRVVGTADLNIDGQQDIILQDSAGKIRIWNMQGKEVAENRTLNPNGPADANWKVAAIADMDANGNADLIFQHTDGTIAVWYLNDVNLISAALFSPSTPGDANWRISGVADLNQDGKPDLLFQHTDGTLAVWYLNGLKLTEAKLLNPTTPGDAKWRVIGLSDCNQDGKPDVLFQKSGDGTLAVWFMDRENMTSAKLLNPSVPGGAWSAIAR